MFEKIMGIASIGSSFAHIKLLQRFLEGIIGVIALTIVSAMMAGVLILMLLYAMYAGLVSYGLDPAAAAIAVGGVLLFFTALLAYLVVWRLRLLRELPAQALPHALPQLARISSVTHAFIDGFRAARPAIKTPSYSAR